MMRDYFKDISQSAMSVLEKGEDLSLYLHAEKSDFTRLNHAKVRQTGHVEQIYVDLELVIDNKPLRRTLNLTGDRTNDLDRIRLSLEQLRPMAELVEADPFLDLGRDSALDERQLPAKEGDRHLLVDHLLSSSSDLDLVGIVSHGDLYRGFASTRQQFCWYETNNYNLDWSIYHDQDKAVKSTYAGIEFDPQWLDKKLASDRTYLEYLARPSVRLQPGKYRCFLAPAAISEILDIVSWNGFSARAQQSKNSCFHQLLGGEKSLSPKVNLYETTDLGMGVPFNESGLVKPKRQALFEQGFLKDPLVSSRSAKQYSLTSTAASDREQPQGLWLQPGILAEEAMLTELGTGIYIGNLWYLNFSDRDSCRLTGMTRFASFWVENGQIVGPIEVMRFDESFFNLFGPQLIGLTSKAELMLDASTYSERSTGGVKAPGALIGAMNFTL
jgi:predicted Zn-dependent protease